MKLITTILCGGAGSRLWPVSREDHPKPFIKLADGESLLQKAFLRAAKLPHLAEVLTVSNRELFFKTQDEYDDVNQQKLATGYILEPVGRNTAPAIAMAALYVSQNYGDDALMLVLAADHLIAKQAAFEASVQQAITLAQQNKIVTFGIQPTAPETGFGYIQFTGDEVKRFVEKPSLTLAQSYLASGDYLWNSGMFCFNAGTMLREMARYCPEVLEQAKKCWDLTIPLTGKTIFQAELDKASFSTMPDISIDYAVMEKSNAVAVVACDIGWSDIGSWNALGELTKADERFNRVQGEVLLHEVDNCYIQSESRLVGAVGVKDLLIVDTFDALLIAHKDKAQEVKQIYAALKKDNHAAHKTHVWTRRPWGSYTTLEESAEFKIKRIEVKPGGALSLQRHQHRSEHWVVVAGQATVFNGDAEFTVNVNQSTYIPAGRKHRLSNRTKENLVLIEVQVGTYLGEDDIQRYEDVYGRA